MRLRVPFLAPTLALALSLLAGCAGTSPLPAALAEPAAAEAEAPSPEYLAAQTRWKREITAFDEADRSRTPAEGGVLFVGSSTVRMWSSLAQDFSEWPLIINRGFGGSTMNECRLLVKELVLRYRPSHVLVYAGDNDLAQGRTPRQVMEDFAVFARTVRRALPQARISFIAIKPSPLRARLLPQVQLANEMVAAYLRTQARADYIDVFTPMLDAEGRPRPELFLPDRLHLSAEGYRLWHDVITAQFTAPPQIRPAPEADRPAVAAADTQAPRPPAEAAPLASAR